MANINRNPKKRSKPFEIEDFMPRAAPVRGAGDQIAMAAALKSIAVPASTT